MTIGQNLYKSIYWKILQLCLSFSINLFLTRRFQSALSAEFYSLVYILSLCASFFTLGLDIGLNYYLSRQQISPRAACRIIAVVTILALLISLPLLALFARSGRAPDFPLRQLLFFSACYIAGVLLTTLSGTLFTAYGRNFMVAKYSFGINLVLAALVFSVPVFFSGHRVVESLFFLYFSFSFLQGMSLYIMAVIRYTVNAVDRPSQPVGIRAILRYSFAAFATNFIFFLAGRLCIYLLPYRVSAADLGNFIQAYKLVEYLSLVASFLYYPFIALVAGQQAAKAKDRLLLFLVRLSNTAVLAFCLLMIVTGKTLFPFVYGHSFDRMYGIFLYFIPGLFPVCSSTFFTAYYYGAGRLKYNFISGCIQLLTVFVLFFLLTGIFGIRGAALAFSLASIASMAYDCVIFRKGTPFGFPDLFLMQRADWQMILNLAPWRKPRDGRAIK
jgi:O-antigen/teichoic acid export membrane protein